jgi:hypothetical protein
MDDGLRSVVTHSLAIKLKGGPLAIKDQKALLFPKCTNIRCENVTESEAFPQFDNHVEGVLPRVLP